MEWRPESSCAEEKTAVDLGSKCVCLISASLDDYSENVGGREHSLSIGNVPIPRLETVDLPLCPK